MIDRGATTNGSLDRMKRLQQAPHLSLAQHAKEPPVIFTSLEVSFIFAKMALEI